jgi:aryl-alcohol dehydrogenase-like predicted oxidoreductase
MVRIKPLLDGLRQIGKDHAGMNPAKGSLNWLMCNGAVPIPGARNINQAQENEGSLRWQLTDNEMDVLVRINEEVSG